MLSVSLMCFGSLMIAATPTWGWRIPFFIGALLAVVALIMRRNLHETEAFEAAHKIANRTSSLRALMKYPRMISE
jgi:MHS family alpha-ketoglutarate permease-like MFS transporter